MNTFEYLGILALAMLCMFLLSSVIHKETPTPMRHKRFKHKRNKRNPAKHTHIKRFKPVSELSVYVKSAQLAVEQEAESRYEYHQLRIRSYQQ